MTSLRALTVVASLAIGALASSVARADLCDAGGCPANQYCAKADGGLETVDGGTCAPEPCVVFNDCPSNKHLCDTSHEPHACVQCISTANCPGSKVCDIGTRTCVDPPEAGAPDASADAGEDASAPGDASVPDSGAHDSSVPTQDSATPYDGSHPTTPAATPDAGPDTGTLGGGACTCDAIGGASGAGGMLASVIFAFAFAMRRRRRS